MYTLLLLARVLLPARADMIDFVSKADESNFLFS